MTTWALLAPGPSASAEDAERVRAAGIPLGVIGNAFQLAPWADFLAATDAAWWRKFPEALTLPGAKYTMHEVRGVERVKVAGYVSVNSGVLGLEVARSKGASRILLLGFDMHGTHFFGPYTNGLSNTTDQRRRMHLAQYARWAKRNRVIEVFNCTAGSALKCFPEARLDDFCSDVQVAHAGVSGEVHGGACEHAAPDGAEALQVAAPIHLHHG